MAATHSYPELLIRRGFGDRVELRLGWNYEVGGAGRLVSGNGGAVFETATIERESQMLYGVKAAVSEQDGWRPRSAAILQGYTPPACASVGG